MSERAGARTHGCVYVPSSSWAQHPKSSPPKCTSPRWPDQGYGTAGHQDMKSMKLAGFGPPPHAKSQLVERLEPPDVPLLGNEQANKRTNTQQSKNQTLNQSTSIHQTTNQTIKPTNQPTNRPTDRPTNKQTHNTSSKQAGQPASN